ncbi:PREDICTED: LOW QUALITY PROTEIN: uncharacterized protein LOC106340034 [Brassica oleracea var. oleracea]|uniref:LOW QUALITY PROTEIN: uncharacterized protein LOC106340034 n=1 Tax=Brassica oleracea var. oleracea TaxID=109376 RepID=UPI0006A731D6|nr:PREDICTED: LOW QUALITY PROTEIN: uncharacterized protein LOC106340034 [Brassica oleracea var. oleracea]
MGKKVALVLSLMLLMSMNSVLVSAEVAPTVGQRIDAATNDMHVTKFFNEHAGPAVDTVSSTAKSVYNWFGDKAKEWGL